MSEPIEEVVKRGRWFYEETCSAEVMIVRRKFVDPPQPEDAGLPEGDDAPPPYDSDGFYYYALFEMVGREGRVSRSGTGHFSTLEEAVRRAETVLNGRFAANFKLVRLI